MKEVMKLALKEIRACTVNVRDVDEEIKAPEEALAKQEQGEPVVWTGGYPDLMPRRRSTTPTAAQPAQSTAEQNQGEPVGMVAKDGRTILFFDNEFQRIEPFTEVYITPQQRTWVGLTDDEYFWLQMKIKTPMISVQDYIDAMRMVEAKLKEKNA